jgi:hypothetical protein
MYDSQKISTLIERILTKNGGTTQDWNELSKIVNTRPDEYLVLI